MKVFVYVETAYHNKKRNNRMLRIYQLVKNQPKYLGFIEYTTGSTQGSDSECFHWLIENGYIPKKYYNLSELWSSGWMGKGYYCQAVEDKGYKIMQLF